MTPSIIKSIDLLIQYRELIGVSDVSHVVAVSQILDLSSNELEWVVYYMGHNLDDFKI